MHSSEFLNIPFAELQKRGGDLREQYLHAQPFPFIVLDGLFQEQLLREVIGEFPLLLSEADIQFKNPNEKKLASRNEYRLGVVSTRLVHLMNSQPMLDFLSQLTGIERLVGDPYLIGGGLHQIQAGGFLKLHTDFNKHSFLDLDRRLNVIIYLNEDWEESYGGHIELWPDGLKACGQKLLPVFNRMLVFNTTDFTWHGHPDPLTCPPERTRKSIAFYYYTSGRPASEIRERNQVITHFKARKGKDSTRMRIFNQTMRMVKDLTPPLLLKWYKQSKP